MSCVLGANRNCGHAGVVGVAEVVREIWPCKGNQTESASWGESPLCRVLRDTYIDVPQGRRISPRGGKETAVLVNAQQFSEFRTSGKTKSY